ncbi:MAG: hypothetical protein KDD53_03135 [Bdellovibrionales bacterium]|nr:hypothetical protein [Bdellovibrionales bacterium]
MSLNRPIFILLFILFINSAAYGDGEVYQRQVREQVPEPTPNQASDASFDRRLPPVLAGEDINDSGKRKRVWSTSGSVPVADAPEPYKKS